VRSCRGLRPRRSETWPSTRPELRSADERCVAGKRKQSRRTLERRNRSFESCALSARCRARRTMVRRAGVGMDCRATRPLMVRPAARPRIGRRYGRRCRAVTRSSRRGRAGACWRARCQPTLPRPGARARLGAGVPPECMEYPAGGQKRGFAPAGACLWGDDRVRPGRADAKRLRVHRLGNGAEPNHGYHEGRPSDVSTARETGRTIGGGWTAPRGTTQACTAERSRHEVSLRIGMLLICATKGKSSGQFSMPQATSTGSMNSALSEGNRR
jgi:hypothetical protein